MVHPPRTQRPFDIINHRDPIFRLERELRNLQEFDERLRDYIDEAQRHVQRIRRRNREITREMDNIRRLSKFFIFLTR